MTEHSFIVSAFVMNEFMILQSSESKSLAALLTIMISLF